MLGLGGILGVWLGYARAWWDSGSMAKYARAWWDSGSMARYVRAWI